MDYIVIGEIVKAQGIKGEVKVKTYVDDAERYKKLKVVYINERSYKIETLRIDKTFVFLKFAGVDSRNDAEALVSKKVLIDRVNAVPLDEGSYFVADLIGAAVLTENGKKLGTIKEINSFGAADVIEAVALNGQSFRFPFLNRIVKSVDVQNKTFTVIENKFGEVAVYDD